MTRLAHTRQTLAVLLGVCGVCVLLPGAGRAATAPPGNAAVQEFVESLPEGEGLRTSSDIADFRDEALRSGRVVDRRTRRDLRSEAQDGVAIISLAEASGPQPSGRRRSQGAAGDGESPPIAAVKRAGGDGPGGLGVFLPLILIGGGLAAAAYVLRAAQRAGAATGPPS